MQTISIETQLNYRFPEPAYCLFQIELAACEGQRIVEDALSCPQGMEPVHLAGEDGLGSRFWMRCEGEVAISYSAIAEIERIEPALASLSILPPFELAGETVRNLMPSRYCEVGEFEKFVNHRFGGLEHGEKVQAMCDWIAGQFDYVPGTSDAETSATESFVKRSGVCRDYAHVMIAFARACAIPARMASVYAPRVDPQDFHAVAQLFLADADGVGRWRFVDATGMGSAEEIGLIGVGRDAADISFMTSYGPAELLEQRVQVAFAD